MPRITNAGGQDHISGQTENDKSRKVPPPQERHLPAQCPNRLPNYSSRVTFTVTSADTSRCRRTLTLCSPKVRIGSSRWIFRRSTL